MSLFQLDYNISPPLLSQTRLAVITGNKVCRVNSQLHKLLSVFHLRIDGCLSFSSGLLLSVPLSEGEINKDACGTPAQNSIHTLLLTLARNINQPVRVKEKWQSNPLSVRLRRRSEWRGCQESFSSWRSSHRAVAAAGREGECGSSDPLKQTAISIWHQIKATTQSWELGSRLSLSVDVFSISMLLLN